MDTELLVRDRIDDGGKLIAELLRDQFDVTVAFWAKISEDWPWHLYIGSASVDPEKIGEAGRVLYGSLSRLPGTGISLSDVKLLPASNPTVRDAVALRRRSRGSMPASFHGVRFGNLSFEEVFVYPPPKPLEVIAQGKEDVFRYLESQPTARGTGVYLLARDETGDLVVFLAGHCFIGIKTVKLGDKELIVVDGRVVEVRNN